MSQTVTVLTVADLHRDMKLYEQLGVAVKKHRPDVLALVGDYLDATGKQKGKLTTEASARFLSRLSCPATVFVRGNHEDSEWFAFADEWGFSGKGLHLLDGQSFVYGPLVIVGFPCLMLQGDGLLESVPSDPNAWLPKVIRPFGPAARSLWLMHEPPHGTPLSQEGSPFAGHIAWREAIERFLPLVAVFGHDHATPLKRKQWHHQIDGNSICVNVGQTATGPPLLLPLGDAI